MAHNSRGWHTILEVTLIEITQYELGCIGRQSVKFLCYVTDKLGGVDRWLWGVCKQQSQTIVDIRGEI